jgi:hypothetical protein
MAIFDGLRRLFGSGEQGRPDRLSALAGSHPRQWANPMTMSGLRQRLENLEGVAAIHLELAESGLSGIHVSLAEGADEAAVLDRIRSLLVTYGLHGPTPVTASALPPPASGMTTAIFPDGNGMRVEVRAADQVVTKRVEATPLAAAQAVTDGRSELQGRRPPKVLWIGLDALGEWRVLSVLMREDDEVPTVGSAVVARGWADALDRAVSHALE